MPNIKLRDGSGVETIYNNVDTITVPLANGSGTFTYGLTDEELTFSGDLTYLNYKNNNRAFLPQFQDRITFENVENVSYAFAYCPATLDLSQCHVYSSNADASISDGMRVLNCCDYSYSIPYFHGVVAGTDFIGTTFNGILSPTTYLERLANISGITNRNISANIFINQLNFIPYGTLGPSTLDGIKVVRDLTGLAEFWEDKYQSVYNNSLSISTLASARGLEFLDTLAIPLYHKIYDSLIVSNNLYLYIENCYHLKDILFLTNNGTPYKLKARNKYISLTTQFGYGGDFTQYLGNKKVYDATTYETWKNDPDWFAYGTTYVSYVNKSGSTVNITQQLGYSRYDHDSAVRTINTLPDTTDTGTNTITFKSYQGAFTDGGAIENLTEAEIAVAVSKGWNVGFNTSTT